MLTTHIQLLSSSPEVIKRNIGILSKEFKMFKEDFIKMAFKQPMLFYQKPETVNNNIESSAKILDISKEQFLKMAFRKPPLLSQNPNTLGNKVKSLTELLKIPKEEVVKIILKQPQLLTQNPQTLSKKVEIIKYYNSLKRKPTSAEPSSRSALNSYEKLYKNIFFQILQNKVFTSLTKTEIELKLAELLNSSKDVIAVEIPKFDYIEDFIKFAENYSRKIADKNVFKFTIQE